MLVQAKLPLVGVGPDRQPAQGTQNRCHEPLGSTLGLAAVYNG